MEKIKTNLICDRCHQKLTNCVLAEGIDLTKQMLYECRCVICNKIYKVEL